MASTRRKSTAAAKTTEPAQAQKASRKGGIVLLAPEGAGGYGCAHGSFKVAGGKLIGHPVSSAEEVSCATGGGFIVDPASSPEVTTVAPETPETPVEDQPEPEVTAEDVETPAEDVAGGEE
jgi:hypothetical protein